MTPALRAASRRAVQVITVDGRRLAAGRASLFVLARIGWHPVLTSLATLPPFIWAVEFGYRLVADHRRLAARIFFTQERVYDDDRRQTIDPASLALGAGAEQREQYRQRHQAEQRRHEDGRSQ